MLSILSGAKKREDERLEMEERDAHKECGILK